MKWITREKAKVDRIACPWLIKKFVDKDAEFLFVPKEQVLEMAKKENATPFDIPGVELTHYEENGRKFVSFDAIIKKYKIRDKALDELAEIVRGADADIADAPPESVGLEAAALGFRQMARDDFENMRLQFPFYDALYSYCLWKLARRFARTLSENRRNRLGVVQGRPGSINALRRFPRLDGGAPVWITANGSTVTASLCLLRNASERFPTVFSEPCTQSTWTS